MKPTRSNSEFDVWTRTSLDWPIARGHGLKNAVVLQKKPISGIEEDLCLVEFIRDGESKIKMNDGGFIEELAERKISLNDFFNLLDIWELMKYEQKAAVMRKLIEEEKNDEH